MRLLDGGGLIVGVVVGLEGGGVLVRRKLLLHNSRLGQLIEVLLVILRVLCINIGFHWLDMYVGCVSWGEAYYSSGLVYGFVWEYRFCKKLRLLV